MSLNFVETFPSLAGSAFRAFEKGLRLFVSDDLLLRGIEFESAIEALGYAAEHEDFGKGCGDGERRFRRFLAHDGKQEVVVMV